MEKSLVKQFKAVLGIVSDYPGIEDIIDLERAKKFLAELQKMEPLGVGSVEAGTPPEHTLEREFAKRFNAWKTLFADRLNDWGRDGTDGGALLKGSVDFYENPNDEELGVMVLELNHSNKASLSALSLKEKILEDFSGTWAEVYAHIKELDESIFPELPEEASEK